MNWVSKLVTDHKGEKSRKAFTWAVGLMAFAAMITFHLITGIEIQESLIWADLGLVGSMSALTVYEKKKNEIQASE